MTTATHTQLHHWACDILAARAMTGIDARDPDALRRKITSRKRTEYADKARWYLANHPDITTPEQLADLLEPPVPEPHLAVDPTAAQQAARSRIADRDARRAAGIADCDRCDDTDIWIDPDGYAHQCDHQPLEQDATT